MGKTTNRVHEAAIAVLKDIETGIAVKTYQEEGGKSYQVLVRVGEGADYLEIRSALTVLTEYGLLDTEFEKLPEGEGYILVVKTLIDEAIENGQWSQNEVTRFAQKLADAGVNFPGSADFRSKERK